MLNRVRPDVLGTVRWKCAPENRMSPPGGTTTRTRATRGVGGTHFEIVVEFRYRGRAAMTVATASPSANNTAWCWRW